MNTALVQKIAGVIELVLESSSRINEAKPQKYWYPLSMATYGVEEIVEALDSLCAFRTTMWEKTAAFEEAFARIQGRRHAVMVNSGSSADLLLAFLLTNPDDRRLRAGDEVLIPAVTWPTQIWSAMMAGLRVKLVDVDPSTLNVSLEALEASITTQTRAISVVHLLGNPCDMSAVMALARKHNLLVLEDCCEALGSQWDGNYVGNFGLGAAFSFFFSHHITTMEGGMIVVDGDREADLLRVLRAHGWLRNARTMPLLPLDSSVDPRYAFVNWGFNVRPTELQAGFGLQQLSKLPAFAARRAYLADRFFSQLPNNGTLRMPAVHHRATPSWMALPLMVSADAPFDRDELTAYLESCGVETRPIVAGNLARQPVAAMFPALRCEDMPGAEAVHQRGFYIGLNPMVADTSIDRVLECFDAFLQRSVASVL